MCLNHSLRDDRVSLHEYKILHTLSKQVPPPRTERELFSIGDHDDIDTRLGGAAPSDDYFFDEIYEKSAFVDETTHSSIKDLKLESERDNVPDLLFRSPR